jgi:hypothetical protein
MLTALVDFLNAYFDKLTFYIQKHTHPKVFKTTHEDTNRCVIYTCLVIGDIIKFLGS